MILIGSAYTSGGIDYVAKPVDPDILLLKIKTFYRLSEQTRQLIDMERNLRAFIASHDLQEPLRKIQAFSGLAHCHFEIFQRIRNRDSYEGTGIERSSRSLCLSTILKLEGVKH